MGGFLKYQNLDYVMFEWSLRQKRRGNGVINTIANAEGLESLKANITILS